MATFPQDLWTDYTSLLSQQDYQGWGQLWADDGRLIIVYGDGEFEKECHAGRKSIVDFMSGARTRISHIQFENDVVWPVHSELDPNAFFVTCDFHATTNDQYHCHNRLVCRFKLDDHGKICELIEYADPNVRGAFLRHLKTSALAAQVAPGLIADHLRTVDRVLVGFQSSRLFMPMNIEDNGWVRDAVLGVNHQARHIYGLFKAHEFAPDRAYLTAAIDLAEAFVQRFVNWSPQHPYFYETIDLDAVGVPPTPDTLSVNHQAYGLSALVALFKATGARDTLAQVRALHEGLMARFHDPVYGGFFDQAQPRDGTNNGQKSFNSTVYVATSYLRELVDCDPDTGRQEEYRKLLQELADIVVDKLVADEMLPGGTGFIRENFTADWQPQWRDWQRQTVDNREFTISPVGHNTQVAWFLLEMFERTGADRYKEAGLATLRSMLKLGFDWQNGGVYDSAKREEKDPAARWMWGTKKAWWQQAETLQALMQADRLGLLDELDGPSGTGRQAFDKALAFWQRCQRPEGGTFAEVEEDGAAISGPHDNPGKGSYHEGQLATVAVSLGGINTHALDLLRPAAAYANARLALDGGLPVDAITPWLVSLSKLGAINLVDSFGLTIAMRAAARGRRDVVKETFRLGASFEVANPLTNANLLHYAAQAGQGGADIVRWALTQANAPRTLLNERILAPFRKDPDEAKNSALAMRYHTAGNGHTVAMEAVFNNNEPVVDVLRTLDAGAGGPGHVAVDFATCALTGWTPRGFALRQNYGWAKKLPPTNQDYDAARKERDEFNQRREDEWLLAHPEERPALELAAAVCHYVLEGRKGRLLEALAASSISPGVAVNGRHGPVGQTLLILIPSRLAPTALNPEQQQRYGEVVERLLRFGADPWIEEIAPMRVAAGFRDAVFGYHQGLRLIIESIPKGATRQAFIDQQGVLNGYTRLNDAAFFGRSAVIALLLDHGADPRIAGFNGRSPYDAALLYNANRGESPPIPEELLHRLQV